MSCVASASATPCSGPGFTAEEHLVLGPVLSLSEPQLLHVSVAEVGESN